MAINPHRTRLDFNQIFQRAFDESEDRLRVDATATIITPPDLQVAINATDDSIAIGDGVNQLAINPDGSINVIVDNATSGKILTTNYFEITGIVSGVTSEILSFMATANNYLQKIDFSGTNIAEYELVISGITQDKKRTYFGNSLNGSFNFNDGLLVTNGELVQVYVLHDRPSTATFNARIQILEG